MSSQLWELLIKIEHKETNDSLTCGECFAVMELLAEGAKLGIDRKRLERLARRHLDRCPDCREQLWKRLGELIKMFDGCAWVVKNDRAHVIQACSLLAEICRGSKMILRFGQSLMAG